jgi:hypothetical protein
MMENYNTRESQATIKPPPPASAERRHSNFLPQALCALIEKYSVHGSQSDA